jgi:predicted amidohydrolase YtcJ
MYRFGPLKMLGDGALGARTAFLSIPYADDETTHGIPVYSKELMDSMISYANKNGMQIAVHTIGDACLDWVLEAYEKALKECPREDHRHGIVHCQIMRADQWAKINKLNLHVYAQTIFLDYDINIVKQRVGEELANTSYCWKSLMKNGVTVSNGSDAPVELPDVMAGIQCAVTRKTLNGVNEYLPDEAFTVKEAIDSFTIQGAKASFEEDKKGKIKRGMLADFVILNENLFEVSSDKIRDVKVLEVYLDGKKLK